MGAYGPVLYATVYVCLLDYNVYMNDIVHA